MTLFQEIDLTSFSGGKIIGIEPGSVAREIGLHPGDELLGINDQTVQDIIDVQFYGAEKFLELLIRRNDELLLFEAERAYGQTLGIEFAHPTFDTDIRRCNNLCEFCFVLQMAPRFRRTLYIKDDDYRYSFLFGHYVTLTNLDDHDWWRIETMKLSPLYISVHVTDLEQRRRYLRNENAGDILEQLRRLTEQGIEIHTQLVIVPEVNDGRWLSRSIDDLAGLWPGVRSISIVPVGLTKQHKYGLRTHSKDEASQILDYVASQQRKFQQHFNNRFVYATDEWYLVAGRPLPPLDAYDGQELHENGLGMVRHFLDEWGAVQKEIQLWLERSNRLGSVKSTGNAKENGGHDQPWRFERITLATGSLFAATLRQAAYEFRQLTGLAVNVQGIENKRLGETISVAGLLMGNDVLAHLDSHEYGDLVVLPRVMFDHPDTITLDDISPQEIANKLSCPVALADTMGDVWDALIGTSEVLYNPATGSSDNDSSAKQ
jgi:putative radical SAM enzyme (TIGR03279 family)